MKLTLRRFFSTVLVLLLVGFVTIHISATEVTELDGARYYIDERIVENDLNYGIKQYTDISYTSATAEQVAGLGSGISGEFEPDKYYPQQVNVLEIPSSTDIKITPWAVINPSSWNLITVRSIIADFEDKNPDYKVIAAINGDFFDIRAEKDFPRVPSGVHVSNGNFYKTGASRTIGFRNDGSTDPLVGNETFTRTEKMQLAIYNEKNEIIFNYEIDRINEAPAEGETSIFFANFNKDHEPVPIDVSNGFIIEEAEYALPIAADDFYGIGTISKKGDATLDRGQFAIVSNDSILTEQLSIGKKIRAQFEFSGEYADIEDAVGGGITLLHDGKPAQVDRNRHPRTMIGVREDGTILMSVIDGRQQRDNMYGVSSAEMATILKHYGAVEGYNLDGGGSSTMVIRNQNGQFEVMNSPSDGGERADANGVLVTVRVPKIDYDIRDVKTDSITVNVNSVIKNEFAIEKLYVGLNGENITEVVDGKVVFTGLNSNSHYALNFYEKTDGEFKFLTPSEIINTAKQFPNQTTVNIYYEGKNLIVEVNLDDPDDAIIRSSLYVNGVFGSMIDNTVIYHDFNDEIETININHRYDLKDGSGTLDLNEDSLKISTNLKIFMEMANYKISNLIASLYSK